MHNYYVVIPSQEFYKAHDSTIPYRMEIRDNANGCYVIKTLMCRDYHEACTKFNNYKRTKNIY